MRVWQLSLLLVFAIIGSSCVITTAPDDNPPDDGNVEIYTSTIEIDSDVDFATVDQFVSVASYEWGVLNIATVDFGIVLAYLRYEGTTAWNSIPLSTPFENDVVVLRYGFDENNFDLIVEGEVADNNNINENLFDGDVLRVVAIPPSLIIPGKGIDYSNYDEVVKLYSLTF